MENNYGTDTPQDAADQTLGGPKTASQSTAGQETASQGTAGQKTADDPFDSGTFQPPPPSFHDNGPKRLYRTEGPIAGVAAGLADYFNVDPVLVRIAMVAAAIVGFPLVPLVYIAAWLIIPQANPAPVPPIMAPSPAGATKES